LALIVLDEDYSRKASRTTKLVMYVFFCIIKICVHLSETGILLFTPAKTDK